MSKFKVGDVVWLKSGSPEMTVTYVGDDNNQTYYQCEWFDANQVQNYRFVENTLIDQNPVKIPKPVLARGKRK